MAELERDSNERSTVGEWLPIAGRAFVEWLLLTDEARQAVGDWSVTSR